jgi:orotate phosphoribosyltransferase
MASSHREDPQCTGKTLYERIVSRRSGLDVQAVAGILRRAEQSFCEWPSERDLKYRDVVQYIVIEEYLRSYGAIGTHTNLAKVVAYVIPDKL